jgi:hypothetical protein
MGLEMKMNNSEHVYTPPRVVPAREVPASIRNLLNGEDLLSKTQAVRISTVDADGWPHAAVLSAGEVLVLPNERIRFVIFPNSVTAANLVRDGRVTLTLSLGGGMCELRMRARKYNDGTKDVPLAFFEAGVEEVREHRAPYAEVTGGISFALSEPSAVLGRWQHQIAALRAAS